MMSLKEKENQQLKQQLQKKDQANTHLEGRERQLSLQLRQLQQERDQALRTQLQEKDRQLGRVNQQLEVSEQAVAQFERRIAELEQQLNQREQQKTKASSRGKELTSFKLRWREGKRAPCRMRRCCDAVVDGNTVYVRKEGSENIYAYEVTSDSWSQLPDSVHGYGSIVVINGWLTTVGGYSHPSYSNELFSHNGKGSGRRWIKKFPPMPTNRCRTISLFTEMTLIVAGGEGDGRVLSTVEVMNTETHQWSTVADLPKPMYFASATVCGDQLYLLGDMNIYHAYTKLVYTCSVSALLQSCAQSSLEANPERTSLVDIPNVWRQLADLPVTRSTCESFHSRLLAIGGRMDSGKSTTTVYMYNSTTNSWKIISHMTTGRSSCFTAVLPDN